MPNPQRKPDPAKRGGPKVGVVVAVVVAIVGLIVVVATRQPPDQSAVAPISGAPMEPGASRPDAANTPGSASPSAPQPGSSGAANAPGPSAQPGSPESPHVDPNDLPPDHPVIAENPGEQVTVQWFGHSCFYLHSPGGATVVTDPFDPKSTGLPSPEMRSHIVTLSSHEPTHGFSGVVGAFEGEKREVVYGRDFQLKDMRVLPIDAGGGKFAYVFEAGPLRIAHLGDIDRPLTADQVKRMGAIDILLAPAGGEGLTPKQSVAMAQQIAPKVVIPMAYSTASMAGPEAKLGSVDAFIAASPYAVTRKDSDVILVSKAELPSSTEIWTLEIRGR